MSQIRYDGETYDCVSPESVLETLLKRGVDIPFSCKKGVCITCVMKTTMGRVPPESQEGLKDTLRLQGYFLPCVCTPDEDIEIALPDDAAVFSRAIVTKVDRCSPSTCRVFLEPAAPFFYHAGQFINLRRSDGLMRSYSVASVPRIDGQVELHVKRLPGGRMSSWIYDELQPNEQVDFQGPNGNCFYVPGRPDQPMLLVGNGTGLAPLIGIARDALHDGHTGRIELYHGTRLPEGLYMDKVLRELASAHPHFTYFPCVSGDLVPEDCHPGRADQKALADHSDLSGWRVFLCGYPPMVESARKSAYLAGAGMSDIYADAFELKELRSKDRD